MSIETLLVLAVGIFAYATVSARLGRWAITAPMVFTALGWGLGPSGIGLVEGAFDETSVEILAEVTLVLVLFADATRIDLAVLRRQLQVPLRLLAIGLPLAIVAGGLVAAALFDGLTLAEAFLIGAILAPTDAALGQAVVSEPAVPVRIRQALNVESGLNDGIALPAVMALAAAASLGEGATAGSWIGEAAGDILFGVVLGAAIGAICGVIVRRAAAAGWIDGVSKQLATLVVPVLAYATTAVLAGNGFLAAFVAGLAFGHTAREVCEGVQDFTEDEGQLLSWLTFFLFGAALLGPAVEGLDWRVAVMVVSGLTVVRMVPVAVALVGTRLRAASVAFLGWFGPRGLASILFVLLVLEDPIPGEETVLTVVTMTVAASVLLHGFTARPLSRRYGKALGAMPDEAPEMVHVDEMRPARRAGLTRSARSGSKRPPDPPLG